MLLVDLEKGLLEYLGLGLHHTAQETAPIRGRWDHMAAELMDSRPAAAAVLTYISWLQLRHKPVTMQGNALPSAQRCALVCCCWWWSLPLSQRQVPRRPQCHLVGIALWHWLPPHSSARAAA
jgi:hypothetical protein